MKTRVARYVVFALACALVFTSCAGKARRAASRGGEGNKWILGFEAGYGPFTPSNSYLEAIGGGVTSGPSQLVATSTSGLTVYRDVPRAWNGVTAGVTLGRLFRRWALDLNASYGLFVADGGANVYTAAPGAIVATRYSSDLDFSRVKVDAGARFYAKPWVYLRPHVGVLINSIYHYTINSRTPLSDSDSEGTSKIVYGGSLMFVIGGGRLKLEFGADYSRFKSELGGYPTELTGKAGPAFYF